MPQLRLESRTHGYDFVDENGDVLGNCDIAGGNWTNAKQARGEIKTGILKTVRVVLPCIATFTQDSRFLTELPAKKS